MDKLACIGLNYSGHCQEQGIPIPESPIIFSKFPSNIIGPRDNILLPQISDVSRWWRSMKTIIDARQGIPRIYRFRLGFRVFLVRNYKSPSPLSFHLHGLSVKRHCYSFTSSFDGSTSWIPISVWIVFAPLLCFIGRHWPSLRDPVTLKKKNALTILSPERSRNRALGYDVAEINFWICRRSTGKPNWR